MQASGLFLLEGDSITELVIHNITLLNTKPLYIGDSHGMGVIILLKSATLEDLNNAIIAYCSLPEINEITTLKIIRYK